MGSNRPKIDAHAFAERLHAAMDQIPGAPKVKRGRAPWLKKKLKVTQPAAWAWLNGENVPTADRVRELASAAGVPFEWLYFGRGSMHDSTASSSPDKQVAALDSQSVRKETVILAVQLAGEALGEDLWLPPMKHAELVLLICELIEEGLPEAKVLHFAQRTITAIDHGGSALGGNTRKNRANT